MGEIIKEIITAPLATLFIVAGMLFLFIAVVGNISGKIEPGERARIVAGILGVIFISTGLTMHLMQKAPESKPTEISQPKRDPSHTTPSERRGNDPPGLIPDDGPKPLESPKPSMQTRYPEVVAELTSFEKTGEFVTVALILRNASGKALHQWMCPGGRPFVEKKLEVNQAKLMDQATGETWVPFDVSGSLWDWCDSFFAPGQSLGAWMIFKVPGSDKKTFSFSLPILNGSLNNLRLGRRS
jgi:hypothetical protein